MNTQDPCPPRAHILKGGDRQSTGEQSTGEKEVRSGVRAPLRSLELGGGLGEQEDPGGGMQLGWMGAERLGTAEAENRGGGAQAREQNANHNPALV